MTKITFHHRLHLPVLLAVTAAVYAGAVLNGFLPNNDDGELITKNVAVRSFDVQTIFSAFVYGLYHPLTSFLWALLHKLFGMEPAAFHALSVILHLLNTALVYRFITLLSGKSAVAFITAGFFAVHPMHVESVAWASELKDVLYAFFYLAALISYTKYVRTGPAKRFPVYALLFMLLSVLSKSAAVSLPVLLLVIDWYLDRKRDRKIITEKIPFFLLSLAFGIVNLYAQESADFIRDISADYTYSLLDRLLLPCYALAFYLWSAVLPLSLSAKHFYPLKDGGALPAGYYLAPLFLALLAVAVLKSGKNRREALAGAAFFLVTIALVLKIVPTGNDIASERYTYLPYIGLFFFLAHAAVALRERRPATGRAVLTVLAAGGVAFSAVSWQRTGVWKDGITLWTNLIEKYPDHYFGYNLRGQAKMELGDYEAALTDLDRAVSIDPGNLYCRVNRGITLVNLQYFDRAIADLDTAIAIRPDYAPAWANRGLARSKHQHLDEAVADFKRAMELGHTEADMYNNFGITVAMKGNYHAAMQLFHRAIVLDPFHAAAYTNRANAKITAGDNEGALADYDRAVELDPANMKALYYRGNLKGQRLGNYRGAIQDYTALLALDPNNGPALFNRGTAYLYLGENNNACADWQKAAALHSAGAKQMLERHCGERPPHTPP